MRQFCIALIVPFLFIFTLPTSVLGADFRSSKWGMSKRDVRKAENFPKDISYTKNSISMLEKLGGLPAILSYDFRQKKLVRGSYSFITKHLDPLEYIKDYKKVKKMLTIKYGQPQKDIKNWTDSSMKSFSHDRGMAIRLGHLTLFSSWDRGKTKIILALYGEDERVKMALTYESMKFLKSREKLFKKKPKPNKAELKKMRKKQLEEDLKKL